MLLTVAERKIYSRDARERQHLSIRWRATTGAGVRRYVSKRRDRFGMHIRHAPPARSSQPRTSYDDPRRDVEANQR
jgi:hypothetical protein